MGRRLRSNASQPPTSPTTDKTTAVVVGQAAPSSSCRPPWQNILSSFLSMLQEQKSQVETLVHERKILEEYIQRQHSRWHSKTRCLRSQVSQMKKVQDMEKGAQEAKMELLLELMRRDALFYKDQFEHSEKDLEDFLEYIETLGQKILELSKKTGNNDLKTIEDNKEEKQDTVKLETEMRKLKHAHKKLVSKRDSEISALLAEKDFIWNQFKKLDEDCTDLRKIKHIELEQAHEALEKLQATVENLQSSVTEKDETITRLRADLAGIGLNLRKCSKEKEQANEKLAKLQTDMEELRRSANEKNEIIAKLRCQQSNIEMTNGKPKRRSPRNLRVNSTPMAKKRWDVRHGKSFSSMENGNARVLLKQICLSGGSYGSQASGAANALKRSSKTEERSFSTSESPKLFSSRFKVPKLKDLTPYQILADAND